MSCSETTAKVLKDELTIGVTTQCGPITCHMNSTTSNTHTQNGLVRLSLHLL